MRCAWGVVPNHVHMVITPESPFSELMRWLKWTTARRSNQLLGRRGITFWQDESYDHWIRTTAEFEKIVAYVEWNPVAAGLVEQTEQWQWSSGKKAGDMIACPTKLPLKCRNSRGGDIAACPDLLVRLNP